MPERTFFYLSSPAYPLRRLRRAITGAALLVALSSCAGKEVPHPSRTILPAQLRLVSVDEPVARASYDPHEAEDPEFPWNDYVVATIAFLYASTRPSPLPGGSASPPAGPTLL